MSNIISLPKNRVSRLKRLINSKDIVRTLESHNALTGMIIDKINIIKNNKVLDFDGMWSSSLTDSATKGLPDNSSLSFSARISSLQDQLLSINADNRFKAMEIHNQDLAAYRARREAERQRQWQAKQNRLAREAAQASPLAHGPSPE